MGNFFAVFINTFNNDFRKLREDPLKKGARMGKQGFEKVVVHCIKHHAIHYKKDVRITDTYNHFLGRVMEGRVYLYCGKCKTLMPTTISISK